MFVIIEFLSGTDILGIKSDADASLGQKIDQAGHILFDSEKKADDFAEENCAFDWKVVEI